MPTGVYQRATQEKRFWDKVVHSENGCWEWIGAKSRHYGQFRYNGGWELAHRVSWQIHFGSIPEGLCVLHRCDNPSCVNPDHLFLGTTQDNSTDRNLKGRQAKGEKNGGCVLTAEDVDCIRSVYANGDATQSELSKHFHVTQQCISLIVNNQKWKE